MVAEFLSERVVGCEGAVWVCGLGWHCDFIFTGMVNKTDSDTNDETCMYLGRRSKIDRECVRDTTSICGSIILFVVATTATTGTEATNNGSDDDIGNDGHDDNGTDGDGGKTQRRRNYCCFWRNQIIH